MFYKKAPVLSNSSTNGFTLVELLVVISVMVLLTTLGIASFISYNNNQLLNQGVNDIVTMLQTAKSRAQNQVNTAPLECGTAVSHPIIGWGVQLCHFTDASGTPVNESSYDPGKCALHYSSSYDYLLQEDCAGYTDEAPPTGGSPGAFYPTAQNLPKGISIDQAGTTSTGHIEFHAITGDVDQGSGTIKVKGFGMSKTINITKAGVITVTTP